MALLFKEIKPFISRNMPIAVCLADNENLPYYTYLLISDIPEGKYDDLYVGKIQITDLEFSCDVFSKPDYSTDGSDIRVSKAGEEFKVCFEIFLYKEPANCDEAEAERKVGDPLTFGRLKNYLWYGATRICNVDKSWLRGDEFVDISYVGDEYNDLYLYGLGIEDNPDRDRISKIGNWNIEWNSPVFRRYFIALSENPRE